MICIYGKALVWMLDIMYSIVWGVYIGYLRCSRGVVRAAATIFNAKMSIEGVHSCKWFFTVAASIRFDTPVQLLVSVAIMLASKLSTTLGASERTFSSMCAHMRSKVVWACK